MHPLKNIRLLLQPSLSSAVLSLVLSLTVVGLSVWFADVKSGVLLNTLTYGGATSAATVSSSQITLSQFNDRIFGNPLLNKVLFYGLWLFIGCLAYMAVSAVLALGGESAKTATEMDYVNASRSQMKQVFLSRLGLRLIAIVLTLVYAAFFTKLLLPYAFYAIRVGINSAAAGSVLLYVGLGAAVLLVSLHIFVVLLRLITLRTRLFNSD